MRKVGFSTPKTDEEGGFAPHRFFHLSNFGAENRILFSSKQDFDRFEAYLYLLNAVESPRVSNFFLEGREKDIFESARGELLVAIGAYSFTQRRFDLLVRPLRTDGVAKFMQKLQTAYTMYFNIKYQRSGRIFHAAYKSVDIPSEAELKKIFAFVHLSPASLFNQDWNEAGDDELRKLAFKAMQYRYSSASEYQHTKPRITDPSLFPKFAVRTKDPDVHVRLFRTGKKDD